MHKYIWNIKMKGLFKGVSPEVAQEELDRIQNVYGSLTPENILAASTSDTAILHPLFTWDDSIAAQKHRLQEARVILNNIEITTVSDGEIMSIPCYEIVPVSETQRAYKNIISFDPEDIDYIRSQTIKSLNALKIKLSLYKDFQRSGVIDALETVLARLGS